jgi:hypothetical protein
VAGGLILTIYGRHFGGRLSSKRAYIDGNYLIIIAHTYCFIFTKYYYNVSVLNLVVFLVYGYSIDKTLNRLMPSKSHCQKSERKTRKT